MSTATDFQFRDGWFPPYRMVSAPPDSSYDYVDVSLQDAYNLFWLLESLEITTTGTNLPSSINWTTTFGPTQSLPFTPIGTIKGGAYYNNSNSTSCPPNQRASIPLSANGIDGCNAIYAIFDTYAISAVDEKYVVLSLVFDSTSISSSVRIYYRIVFAMRYNLFSPYQSIIVSNPNGISAFVGTPSGSIPSSGTFSILGVSFNWAGGGFTRVPSAWTGQTVTISATSSAFTF